MFVSQGMDGGVVTPKVPGIDGRMVRVMSGILTAVLLIINGALAQATTDPFTTEPSGRTPSADGSEFIEVVEPMNDETVGLGQKISLRCRIQGYPTPTYWWYKNNAFIQDGIGGMTIKDYSGGSKLTIRDVDTIHAGSYKCIAENIVGHKTVTGVITISPDIVVSDTDMPSESSIDDSMSTSRCEQYRGIVCRQHIMSSIYIQAGQEQEDIEQELAAAFVRLQSMPDIGETCGRYIIPSICLTAFPLCNQKEELSVHQLCHDECNLLETDTCSDLYDYVDTNVELDLVGILPICSDLPAMGEPGSETCMRLGLSDSGVATISPFNRPRGDYIHLERPMNNETLYASERAILRCRITGRPKPRYKWYKNDVQIVTSDRRYKGFNIREYEWGSKLTIKNVETTDTGYYTCEADSRAGTQSTTGILYVRLDTRTSEPGENVPQNGYCQPYRGMTCSTFIGNNSIYVTDYLEQSTIEERLTGAFVVIADDLSPQCQEYAIPSLCYFAFPFCDTTAREPRGRDLCRDECEILEQDICKREYEIAKEYPGVVLPECSLLPEIGTKESEKCVRIGIPAIKGISDATCYNGTGVNYRGKMNRTKSGYACQPWDAQSPHIHYLRSSVYRELAGGHSYCRNPGNGQDKPWCYTMNPDVMAEKCDIPKCNDVLAEPVKQTEVIYILIPSVAMILIIGVICACVYMCFRQRNGQTTGLGGRPSEMVSLQQKQQVRDFPLAAVKFHEVLGEGTFGKVYKGELMGYEHQYSLTPVTIKTLREGSTPKMQQDFRHEAEVMSSLRHPNIISLLGVCMREAPLCTLFEYMPHGDLHEFLIRHSPNSDVGFGSGDDETQSSLDQSDFLSIAIQIASGMEYLSSRHFVHRDLAARNCMVGDNLQIKIADFGLSRDIYAADYYITPTQALMPLRWMAPETINFGQFSEASDIWSFGVVIWEIYSYGLQPFYGYNNHEVLNMIRTRHILPCPHGCPPHMYALMTECWNEAPDHRPKFKAVCSRLRSWESIPTTTTNGNMYTNPIATYNTPPPEYTPTYGLVSPAQTHSSGHKSHASSMHSRSTHNSAPKNNYNHHGGHLGSYTNSHPSSFPNSLHSSRHDSFHGSFHGSNHGSQQGSNHGSTTFGSNHNSSSHSSSNQNSNHDRAPSESSASSGTKRSNRAKKENVEQTAV